MLFLNLIPRLSELQVSNMKSSLIVLLIFGFCLNAFTLPREPIEIGNTPQFFVDDHVVDNRFALKNKSQAVLRKFHPPTKHPDNPLITEQEIGFVNVIQEPDGTFKLWAQTYIRDPEQRTEYAICYAHSKDGLEWHRPSLGLYNWMGSKENNIVYRGPRNFRASGPQILLNLPERDRRGYRYLMTYRTSGAREFGNGIRVVGSQDGIHWDKDNDFLIKDLHSDTLNSIVYDSVHDRYLMTCRAKDRYRRTSGEIIDVGASRRVSVIENDTLWEEWEGTPSSLLVPDEQDLDAGWNFFYGMPVHYHAGIYWGFLWKFRLNDPIVTELITSRDGRHWTRLPSRPDLLPLGEDGAWDDGMIFAGPHWVEVGNEWRFYYSGSDGAHDAKVRSMRLGVATVKKERLYSINGPKGGGVVVTRRILWPGGDLVINADASKGQLKVRLSDAQRKPLEGFDYDDCLPMKEDALDARIQWKSRNIDELKGQEVRMEFYLESADLFTLRAGN